MDFTGFIRFVIYIYVMMVIIYDMNYLRISLRRITKMSFIVYYVRTYVYTYERMYVRMYCTYVCTYVCFMPCWITPVMFNIIVAVLRKNLNSITIMIHLRILSSETLRCRLTCVCIAIIVWNH